MGCLFFLIFLIFSGCGIDDKIKLTKDEYELSDITQPTVLFVTPFPEQKGVPVDTSVIVTFSEPVNPDTVNELSFYITSKNGRVNGTYIFSTDLKKVIFSPAENLEPLTTYSITINNRIKDTNDNELADQDQNDKIPATPFSSVFTTESKNGVE